VGSQIKHTKTWPVTNRSQKCLKLEMLLYSQTVNCNSWSCFCSGRKAARSWKQIFYQLVIRTQIIIQQRETSGCKDNWIWLICNS